IHLASRGLQVTPRATAGVSGESRASGRLLTNRETEIVPFLQQGHSNAQVALELQVGVETVRTHARNIYRKLGVSSRRELRASPLTLPDLQPAAASPLRHAGGPVA